MLGPQDVCPAVVLSADEQRVTVLRWTDRDGTRGSERAGGRRGVLSMW